jgi:DNA-directed RNA polymerase subunit RPC12/RpoP
VTQNGTVLGTPEYMAPEQARGERVDQRADLFSLGSVLYAMCTGHPPFQALSALAMLRQVSEETPTPVRQLNPGIPGSLEAIISKLMQKDPDRRFQQAAEVAGVLEGFLAHLRQPDTMPAPTLEGSLAESATGARAPKRRRRAPLFLIALVVCVSAAALLAFALFFQDTPQTADTSSAPPFATEVYQDFRGKPPMLPQLRLLGPDLETVAKSEEAGFRITLPKTRKAYRPVEIAATFAIKRDFEITGTYELLAADMPLAGFGVGVCLNISSTNDLRKFLKISRVLRPDLRSVFMAEYWTKGADDWAGPQVDTEVKGGQLRLVREGSRARCLVSEGPGKEFKTIFEKDDFGTEDMAYLHFQVTDGGKPGSAIDARLLDLRIRHDYVGLTRVAEPVAPALEELEAKSSGTRALILAASLMVTLIAVALVSYIHVCRRRDAQSTPRPDVMNAPPAAAHAVIFPCTACGKKLKIKATSAGKKVKCPHCGQTAFAPNTNQAKA